ncbi:MAG: (d)CMP kinase [Prevotella sp.]|jgi:cytidylate kinase|nr:MULTISPECIES: (d)CMP kinase [unclassified Prevotella]MCH3970109.1 (d)CMP kinase [Prevotella sp.]MCH3984835.1 (d)CMP kinase [Prevotella sp.]MCH3992538.1 (d)CMP kinase [Prevotella sp.]MCH4016872.1 (d)CMP kinase [Prevotella sp.]MCH4099087.1 (d)CMP kinase [Prevotella sp.]
MEKIIIAIDGYSSCGKSTMAKDLAREIGYIYIDTGAMYRAVTLYAMQHHIFNEDGRIRGEDLESQISDIHICFRRDPGTGLPLTFLNGKNVEQEIRSLAVSSHVSPVAALPFVRKALVAQQQEMGKDKGIVMDGRDIGTVVFPHAELKIFVTARADVRARRRYEELQAKGMSADYDAIFKNIQQRDFIDSHRTVSPLRKAEDAIELDNSDMTITEQKDWLLEHFRAAAHL